MRAFFIFVFLSLELFSAAVAQELPPLLIDDSFEYIPADDFLYVEQGDQSGLLPDIRDQLTYNQPVSVTFSIQNNSNAAMQFWLRHTQSFLFLDRVTVRNGNDEEVVSNGVRMLNLPLLSGERLELQIDLKQLYRMEDQKLQLEIVSDQAIEQEQEIIYISQSFFIGLFLFLAIYHLLFFIFTRWSMYWKYAIYILLSCLYILYYFGLLQDFWPGISQLSPNIIYSFYSLIFITYFLFIIDLGGYRDTLPQARKLLLIGIWYKSAQIVFEVAMDLLGVEFIYGHIYSTLFLTLEILLIGSIIYTVIQGRDTRGKIVWIGTSFLIVAGVLAQLIPLYPDRGLIIEAGITLELMTFSIGMGYLFNQYQRNYISELEKNKTIRDNLNRKLEKEVESRTAELENQSGINEMLVRELRHRTKNNLNMISSFVRAFIRNNRLGRLDGENLQNKIRSIAFCYDYVVPYQSFSRVPLKTFCVDLRKLLVHSYNITEEQVRVKCDAIELSFNGAQHMALILNEILLNFSKHGKKDSNLVVSILRRNDQLNLTATNPLAESVKQTAEKPQKMGVALIRDLAELLHGGLTISESTDEFSISIEIPIVELT